jgi:hypothetical protein
MAIRSSMMLVVTAALAAVACESPKTETKTEPNPAVAPPAQQQQQQQPVTNTNAQVNSPTTTPAAPNPTNPIASAANESEVKQFAEQVKIPATQSMIVVTQANIRPAPQSTDKVEVGKQGLSVTELAKNKDYFLVLYNDPQDPAKQKAGWIYRDALGDKNAKEAAQTPKPTAQTPKLTCEAGQFHMQTDRDFCAAQCKADSDCKKLSGVCDGEAKIIGASGAATPAHYCVTATPASPSTTP